VLDGVIQVTERDEFAYQEMIVHVPLMAHPLPKKVLIIGGGDGGVLREVAKHPVEVIHMCEIDPQVVAVAQQYFTSSTGVSFHDPRLTLLFEDAAEYLKQKGPGMNYDCIICDSSDPVGPAEILFQKPFFESMRNALAPDGIVCTQAECIWNNIDVIKELVKICSDLFSVVKYLSTYIPTYPSGQIGFMVMSNQTDRNLAEPSRSIDSFKDSLRYYTTNIHRSSFVLPGMN
jgi:spermidine synthase